MVAENVRSDLIGVCDATGIAEISNGFLVGCEGAFGFLARLDIFRKLGNETLDSVGNRGTASNGRLQSRSRGHSGSDADQGLLFVERCNSGRQRFPGVLKAPRNANSIAHDVAAVCFRFRGATVAVALNWDSFEGSADVHPRVQLNSSNHLSLLRTETILSENCAMTSKMSHIRLLSPYISVSRLVVLILKVVKAAVTGFLQPFVRLERREG